MPTVINFKKQITSAFLFTKNDSGRIPIQEVCKKGDLAQVKSFLNHQDQLLFETDDRNRSLTHLAALSGNEELFDHLVFLDPQSLNYLDQGGNTPLHLAAQAGNLCIVREAIRLGKVHRGPSLDQMNKSHKTPMMLAASKNHREVIRCLVHAGASTDLYDFHDRTVFHISALHGYWNLLGDLLAVNPEGAKHEELFRITPLDYAAAAGNEQAISKLILCGAKVNHVAHDGRTALHQAARNNQAKAIHLLHKKGANLDVRERDSGMTPLHEAIFGQHVAAVKSLKELGANLKVGDNRGGLPIDWARYGKNQAIIRILES